MHQNTAIQSTACTTSVNRNDVVYQATPLLFRFADEVSIGDEVLVSGGSALTVAKVINTDTLPMKGKFKFLHLSFYKFFSHFDVL